MELLSFNNCIEMQGYLFSRPLPADVMTAWLVERVHTRTFERPPMVEPERPPVPPARRVTRRDAGTFSATRRG